MSDYHEQHRPMRGCLNAAPFGLAFWALLYYLWPNVALYLAVAILAACLGIAAHADIQARLGRKHRRDQ